MAKSTTPDTTLDTTTPDAASTAASPVVSPADLTLGESAFLTAVHGLIVHPFTGLVIDVGTPTKVEVDAWVLMQHEAGKLAKA